MPTVISPEEFGLSAQPATQAMSPEEFGLDATPEKPVTAVQAVMSPEEFGHDAVPDSTPNMDFSRGMSTDVPAQKPIPMPGMSYAPEPTSEFSADEIASMGTTESTAYKTPLDSLNQAKNQGIQAFQQNLGKPAGESLMKALGGQSGAYEESFGSGGARSPLNLLARQALVPIAGAEIAEPGPLWKEEHKRQAVNGLIDAFGDTGAAFAQGLFSQIPSLPLMFVGGGLATKGGALAEGAATAGLSKGVATSATNMLIQGAKVAGTGAGAAAEGALFGGAQAAITPGTRLEEGAASGALLGGVLGASAAGLALGARKAFALLTSDAQKTLTSEIVGLTHAENAASPAAVKKAANGVLERDLNPTHAVVMLDGEGEPLARIYTLNSDGTKAFVDLPLHDEAAALKFAQFQKDHELGFSVEGSVWGSPAVQSKSRQWEWNVMGNEGSNPSLRPTPTSDEHLAAVTDNRAKQLPKITSPLPSLDGPGPVPAPEAPLIATVDDVGHVKLQTPAVVREQQPMPVQVAERGPGAPQDVASTPVLSNPNLTNAGSPARAARRGDTPTPVPTPQVASNPGPVPPLPQPPAGGPPLPPAITANQTILDNIKQRVQQGSGTLWERLMKQVMGKGLRGERDLAQYVTSINASKALQDTSLIQDNAFKRILSSIKMPTVRMDALRTDMGKVAEGALPIADLWARYPEAEPVLQRLLTDSLQEIQDNHKALQAHGVVGNDKDPNYQARTYLKNVLKPGAWARIVTKSHVIMDDGINIIKKQAAQQGSALSNHEVEVAMLDLMGAEDPFVAFKSSPIGAKYFNHLKRREDLPVELRRVMGEITDGPYRISVSLGVQRSNLALQEVAAQIAMDPRYAWNELRPRPIVSEGGLPLPALHTEPLPADKKRFGAAAGMYVHPDIYDVMVNGPRTIEAMPAAARWLYSHMKANQIGLNPNVMRANLIEDIGHSTFAGGLDIFRPVESAKAMVTALQGLFAYRKNPSAQVGPGLHIKEAREFGSIRPGAVTGEVAAVQEQFEKRFLREVQAQYTPNTSMWDLRRIAEEVQYRHMQFRKYSGVIQEWLTMWSRAANHISLMDKFTSQPGTYGVRERLGMAAGQGLDRTTAAQRASLRINQSFQDPSNVGELVQTMRATPIFGTYIGSKAEEGRVWALMMARMKTESDLRWRVGMTTLALGTVFGAGGVARRMMGPDEQTLNEVNASLKKSQLNYTPSTFISPSFDEKGRAQVYNLTGDSYLLGLAQGNDDDALWRKALSNVLTYPVTGTSLEDTSKEVLSKTGLIRQPQIQPPKQLEGEGSVWKGLRAVQDAGLLGPSVISTAMRTAEKMGLGGTGQMKPTAEQWTASQGLQKNIGIPFLTPVSLASQGPSPSYLGVVKEETGQLRDLQNQIRIVASDQTKTQEQKRAIIDAISTRIKTIGAQMRDKGDAVNANRR